MCGFLGSYFELRFGSSVLAAAEGCDMYFGLTAFSNSTGWCDGMAIGGWREMEGDKRDSEEAGSMAREEPTTSVAIANTQK
jgi:hypothetical protein